MARVKRGVTARRRHKKVLKQAKGYYGARSRVYRVAKQAVTKAGQYAYIGRKQRKRQFRSLWIARINAAARQFGLSYSRMIDGLAKAGITVDRKVMADLAVHDIKAFGVLAEHAKAALDAQPAPATKPAEPVKPAATPKPAAAKAPKPEPVAEQVAEPEPEPVAAKVAEPKPAAKPKASAKPDDLAKIEGIGPKIAEVLHGAGIESFAALADADVEHLKTVLHEAGNRFASHDPGTWPQQSALAAAGKWDELAQLHEHLKGGREA